MTSLLMRSVVRSEIREFLRLAVPLASAQVAQAATGFVDTVMMGWLGRETLAAGGLASITFFALLVPMTGVVSGVSPLIAEAYGAGRHESVGRIARQGFWLALVLTLPMMALLGNMGPLMRQFGQGANTIALAKTYLDVMLWGFFPVVGFALLRSVVAALSQARPIMMIVIGGTLFNTVGNYVLGFGKWGFPNLGLAGLALSSILAQWGMFLALVIYMFRHPRLQHYRIWDHWQLEPKLLWNLTQVGVPIGVFSLLEVGLFTTTTYLMGALGTDMLAAHQIVFQVIVVIFMVPLGMSYAATVRVGQWHGQHNLEGVRRAGTVSMGLGTAFMILMTIALLTFPTHVIGLYLDLRKPENADVLALAMPMLSIAAIAQVLDGLQKTAYGSLQGLQDTRIPMLLSLPLYWGAGMTSGYLLGFPLGLGGVGLWLGQSAGIAIAAAVFVWRFYSLTSRRDRHSI